MNPIKTQGYAQAVGFNPGTAPFLLDELPSVIHLRAEDRVAGDSLDSLLRLISREISQPAQGSDVLIEHLLQLLFIQIVRSLLALTPKTQQGWLAATRDPRLGKVITHLHQQPEHQWTVANLAELVNMSRSSFAAYFKQLVGLSPKQYLIRWRMQTAAHYLKTRNLTVQEVAVLVGYESQATFSRVFKQYIGMPPASYGRQFN